MRRRIRIGLVVALVFVSAPRAYAVPQDESSASEDPDLDLVNEFASLDLADLMNVQIAAVAGTEQGWFQTPAATTVLTGDDIRRSGHASIPEALRLVPGAHVGRIGSNLWSVNIRGFSDLFANELQTVMDGRVLYDPLFSGTLWDVQDTILDDVERIEVVRGPGATLWGANAVNGVISIRTKSAADTQGWSINAFGGTQEFGGSVRYGGRLGDAGHFRVWGKYRDEDNALDLAGNDRADDWSMVRGGFRADWAGDEGTTFTLQGDAYDSDRIGSSTQRAVPNAHLQFQTVIADNELFGGNVLFRMTHDDDESTGWKLQTYFDRTERTFNDFGVDRNTFDVDFRHHLEAFDGTHAILWGLQYNHTRDAVTPGPTLTFDPDQRGSDRASGFAQDTITLSEHWSAMIGTKLEYNDYTDFEIQPSGRIWWTPDDKHTTWAAVSRPVRTPSRTDANLQLITAYADPSLLAGGPPSAMHVPLAIVGNPDAEAEELLSFELGHRVELTDGLVLDIAAYYNEYDNLLSSGTVGTFQNDGEASVYGGEVFLRWQVADNWRLDSAYSLVRMDADSARLPGFSLTELETPQQQFQVQSRLDITDDLEFNAGLYWVDEVPAFSIDAYWRLDLGFTWRPMPNVELAVWGQNLFDPEHAEYSDAFFLDTTQQIPRSAYAQLTIHF